MITIYKTDTMKDACAYVTDILRRVDKRNLSVMHTVLVPDRASMEAERALLDAVGGSFNAQVRTFRRLAADIIPKYNYLSKQSGIMAMSGIVADNLDRLQCYVKSAKTSGFAEQMYDTISMLKYCRITPSALAKANLPKGVQGKAKDIALLYQAYLDYTRDRFIDSADKLDVLREVIEQGDVVANSYFYLYDFDNLSSQELALVEQLMLRSKGVTVACCVGKKHSDRYLYLNDIYNGVLNVCKRNGITPQIIEGKGSGTAVTEQIGEHMFRYDNAAPIDASGKVELFCGDRQQEVYALACRLQRYVRNGGRYRDAYVVTSDVTQYTNLISTIFDELEIPYFCDRQYALSDHPYARFVLDYLAMARSGFKLTLVLPFVKNYLYCGFCGNADAVFRFENYCLKYNVSYNYERLLLGKDDPDYDVANELRAGLNELIKSNPIPSAATGKQYVDAIRKLIAYVDLPARNAAFAEEQRQRAEQSGATEAESQVKVTLQAADKLEQTLTQAEMIIGERYMRLDEFIKTLTSAVASVKISVLPVRNDCVVFANMAKARKHDVKLLALLGTNYGALPIVKGDGKLLTDKNLRDLQDANINVEPLTAVENKRERFSVFQLLQEPSELLYVSYCVADGANSLAPSPVVTDLKKLFTVNGKELQSSEADEEVYTERQALAKVILNRRRLKDNQVVRMPAFAATSKLLGKRAEQFDYDKDGLAVRVERGAELYLKNSSTSVSQLTDFFKCPYRFFVQYGLNVKPRTVAKLKTADLGNILHSVLENYVRNVDLTETDAQTEQRAEAIYEEVLSDDFYRGIARDETMHGALLQLKTESVHLCNVVKHQLQNSDFTGLACELNFDTKEGGVAPVEVSFDGGKFLLVGKIDRVDRLDNKFIVIDYKSGSSAAHYTEKDLYIGQKMQLPVYLKAVIDAYDMEPVGFFYFNIHDEFTSVNSDSAYVYKGRLIDDVDVAKALDNTLKTHTKSTTLGVKFKADGTFNRQGNTIISSAQLHNQMEYALRLIRKAGNLMINGYAAVSPYEGACEYCDYKDICDFNQTLTRGERKLTDSVTAATIDDALTSCAEEANND